MYDRLAAAELPVVCTDVRFSKAATLRCGEDRPIDARITPSGKSMPYAQRLFDPSSLSSAMTI